MLELHLIFCFILVDHTKYLHQHPSAEEDFPSEENLAAPAIRLVDEVHALPPTGSNYVAKQTSEASNIEEGSALEKKGMFCYVLQQ